MITSTLVRKVLTATAVTGVAVFSMAQEFKHGEIHYKILNENSVETFRDRTSLPQGEIVIPAQVEYNGKVYNVTKIGASTFFNAQEITSITLPDTIDEIKPQAFMYCGKLEKINLPNSITQIGADSFRFCRSLKEIVIPNKVSEIRGSTFSDCSSLTKIVLPKSVTKIGYFSFQGLYSLKEIIVESETPPALTLPSFPNTPKDGLYNGKKDVIVRVPKGSKGVYEATQEWKEFTIVEDETLSTQDNKVNTSVSAKVYPNPTTGIFFIETENPTTANIFTMAGQMVKSVKLNKGKSQVDISHLSSGLYLVQVENITTKVIKK